MFTSQIFPSKLLPFTSFQAPPQKLKLKEARNSTSQHQTFVQHNNLLLPEAIVFDSSSAVNALSSCTTSRNLELGSCLHALILKSGLCTNVFVNNSLLGMYTKCGSIEDAAKLFEKMPERTLVTWTSMISGYSHNGATHKAISIFSLMLEDVCPNEFTLAAVLQACAKKADSALIESVHSYVVKTGLASDGFLQNSLIAAYAKSGSLWNAEKLLERFSCRDVVSWTSVISGCVLNEMMVEALVLFVRMRDDGVLPNEVTILSVLHACSLINQPWKIHWVHGLIVKMGWCNNDLVMNSLVEMYIFNGHFREGMGLFCGFCFSGEGHYLSPETMATLLQGCGHCQYIKLGKQMHGYLIKHGFFPSVVENSIIDMYAENGESDSSYQIFVRMNNRDVVSWNTMITCLVKNGEPYQALMMLKGFHRNKEGGSISPDFITMLASIQACSNMASLQQGQIIHGYMTKGGLIGDIFIQNALIDMYGRSGKLVLAEKTFEEMPIKDLGSWNSLIAAYGVNGRGISALHVFTELKKSGIHKPNAITYVNILSACAHAGMVKEGFEIFRCMYKDGVEPGMEHFVCMVDLLGRLGRLDEAEAFIEKMPVLPGSAVWGALLGACGFFGKVDIAERAAKQLSIMEAESKIWRVALSNVYASVGRWDQAAKVRTEMKGLKGMGKEGGWSSVEVGGETFKFMVNDTRHSGSEMIYKVLGSIKEHMREEIRT
ncbi:hypothetical protein JRO89_XS13G0157700 [Xanthoceras sorbifolium]|uniref:Pentatricopeptide repeat-containing protein n=1 Tax=Xanthoceras sorbifolium TaxID=99658 RepID=A0ABQ8H8I3_9ROSI|nr:hypothetical protein JRO89_XS13G0157700 [Xanthoceras sorbifolium]